MTYDLQRTWETYTSSWKAESSLAKRDIFDKCLDPACTYTDPNAQASSWDQLLSYMVEFHQQVPGGHFVTTYFLAYNNQSIAKWNMKTGDDKIIGEGISYCKYNANGKLVEITGFFETP